MAGEGWEIHHATRAAQHVLPDDVARHHGAVVVGSRGETVLIGVHDPNAQTAQALSVAARRPVELLPAARMEIDLALARFAGEGAAATQGGRSARSRTVMLRLRYMLGLIRDLGLHHVLSSENRVALSEAEDLDSIDAILACMPRRWGQEILGLLDGLPHLSDDAAHVEPALQLLLPPGLRGTGTVAAWTVEGDTLLLLCTGRLPQELMDGAARWSGYHVRCALVEPLVMRQIWAQNDDRTPQTSPSAQRTASTRPRPWRRSRRANETERRARILARQLGEPLEDVQQRLGIPQHQESNPTYDPEPEALALLPLDLLHSLQFLPLRVDGEQVEVVAADAAEAGDPGDVAALITALTGYSVRLRRESGKGIRRALARLSHEERSSRQAVPVGTELSVTGDATRGDRAGRLTAMLDAAETGESRCCALAMLHGVPWIRLEHYRLDPAAMSTISPEEMRRLQVVPVRRDGNVLWVAMEEPGDELLRHLRGLTGLGIRALLATQASIADRLATIADQADGNVGPSGDVQTRLDSNPLLIWLQAEEYATKTDLLRLLGDRQVPVDIALDSAGILTHSQFSEAASILADLPLIDLRLRPREEEVFDALGQPTHRKVWTDPVDADISGMLQPGTMRQLGVLPVHRENGVLVVAVSDPFDPATRALLDSLGDEVRIEVAPRPAILTAIARARGHIPLGDRLLAHGIVTAPELARALELHRKTGVRLGRALLTLDMVTGEQLAYVLAEQQNLPFFRLGEVEPDKRVAHLLSGEIQRSLGVVPLYQVGETLTVATPDPLNQRALDEVAARTDLTVTPVVCTEEDLEQMLETLFHRDYLERSTSELMVRTPDQSASRVLNTGQQITLLAIALGLVAMLFFSPASLGVLVTTLASIFYVTVSLYRSYLIYRALSHDLEVPVTDEDLAALKDANLPVYTILVPLFKEASVLPTLMLGLAKLDYPATKLDVKLLLEEDDVETRLAVQEMRLPAYVQPVVVPAAQPRCKPKACNYGLIHARGEYVVIYDAEDVPEPNQLKKVVAAFQKSGPDVACIQAKLNYYNGKQNLLTSWFTTEYSMWFDLFLPGLDAARVPIPLGGTSNHFPTAKLREVGAWDPYNVTEDADLGVRLYRRGWKTAIVDSTTLEEANSEVYNWIRQRSRWVKGYVQTYLVHMRHPVQLWRAIGTKAFFSFNMVVGGTFVGFLLNPIFWTLTALWYLADAGFIRALFPGPVYYMGMISLVVGNFSFIYLNVAGCLRRGHYSMVKHALLSPLYWALMSIAAWKGFLQLWTNPFYWEKTTHGLYRRPARSTDQVGTPAQSG